MHAALRRLARFVYANALPDDLFRTDIRLPRAKQLFREYVRLVEIENHSYCNRVCSFCPNSSLDRLSRIHPLADRVYGQIINDLASLDYDQTLVWARYHEPLAHDSIFDRLGIARKALPKAFLSVTSNGDYLNRDVVRRLEATGINHMCVSLYLPDEKARDPETIREAREKFARRSGLSYGQQLATFAWRMNGTKLQIAVNIPDYSHGGTAISSRAGLVKVDSLFKNYARTSICFSPLHHVVVDYNGKSMLCCQTRSDAPAHQRAVIGEVGRDGYGLFHHYRDLAGARAGLIRGGRKHGVCSKCSQNAEGPFSAGRMEPVAGFLRLVPVTGTALGFLLKRAHRRRRYEFAG